MTTVSAALKPKRGKKAEPGIELRKKAKGVGEDKGDFAREILKRNKPRPR